jgi:hypothetical protein
VTGTWLRVTTEGNAIDFLEKAAEFVGRSDDYKWKWVSISLHAALYAFAICAIRGTGPDRVAVYRKEKGKQVRRLIGFPEALKRCQQEEYMHQYVHSKVLKLRKDEEWAIQKISETLRNSFQHYLPKFWSIEVSGMPRIVKDVSRVIRFLALESGNLPLLEESGENRIRRALAILQQAKE